MNQKQMDLVRESLKKETAAAEEQLRHEVMDTKGEFVEDMASNLASLFAFTLAMVVAVYCGFTYQEYAKATQREFFSLPEQCGGDEQQRNSTMYQYSLAALEGLGEIIYPDTINTLPPTDDASNWIVGGDQVVWVAEKGGWYLAVDSDMSGITGAMLREWFNSANCSDMYRWWHPLDHVYGVWIDPLEAPAPASCDLVARHGYTHRVKEYVNGKLDKLDILFQDPCVDKDCEQLKGQGVELILSAQVTTHQTAVGRVLVGNFTHVLRVDDSGSTLHSRFTFGAEIRCVDHPDSWACYLFESAAPIIKKLMLGEAKARGIFRHCKQEMTVLGKVIRELNSPAV